MSNPRASPQQHRVGLIGAIAVVLAVTICLYTMSLTSSSIEAVGPVAGTFVGIGTAGDTNASRRKGDPLSNDSRRDLAWADLPAHTATRLEVYAAVAPRAMVVVVNEFLVGANSDAAKQGAVEAAPMERPMRRVASGWGHLKEQFPEEYARWVRWSLTYASTEEGTPAPSFPPSADPAAEFAQRLGDET